MKQTFEEEFEKEDKSNLLSTTDFKSAIVEWLKQNINTKKMYAAILFIFLLFIVFSYMYSRNYDNKNYENRQNKILNARLNDMQDTLQRMSQTLPSSPEFRSTLQQLNGEVTSMDKDMAGVAKSEDIQQVAKQLTEIKADVSNLQKTMVSNLNFKDYEDPKILPFQVAGVDVIAEQPFITVSYNNHLQPLGIGDTMAAWQLVNVDYQTATAEFINNQGQRVKVTASEQ